MKTTILALFLALFTHLSMAVEDIPADSIDKVIWDVFQKEQGKTLCSWETIACKASATKSLTT